MKWNFNTQMSVAFFIIVLTAYAVAQTEMVSAPVLVQETHTSSPWWSLIVRQSPSLAILAFVVITFLKHLDKRDDAIQEQHKVLHDTHTESVKALKEVSQALGQNSTQIQRLEAAISRVEDIGREWQTPR